MTGELYDMMKNRALNDATLRGMDITAGTVEKDPVIIVNMAITKDVAAQLLSHNEVTGQELLHRLRMVMRGLA
jgi:hypothetical protein